MKIEIVARRSDSTVWHVLIDGTLFDYIRRVNGVWKLDQLYPRLDGYSVAQRIEIAAATKKKVTLLNTIARLTS